MKMKLGLDFTTYDEYMEVVNAGGEDGEPLKQYLEVMANLNGILYDKGRFGFGKNKLTGNEWLVVKVPLKTTILNRDKHISLIYWRDEAGKLKVGPITNPELYMDGRFINQADSPYEYRTFSKGTKPGGGAGELLFNIGGKCEGC